MKKSQRSYENNDIRKCRKVGLHKKRKKIRGKNERVTGGT